VHKGRLNSRKDWTWERNELHLMAAVQILEKKLGKLAASRGEVDLCRGLRG
jgi:hypothetical protein